MPFDKPTRNLLAKMVAQCRDRLAEDIADQLQSSYGLYPDGTALDVAKTEGDRRAAEDLLALWTHFEAAEASSAKARRAIAYQRLVREIGFTLLNRLAALRLCEERGLLVECVRRGLASDGFQLFDRIAGGALGNRYQTYRAFLESLFDELALDLGVLFDRSTPQSLVFPSEAALTEVLAWLNDPELADRDMWQQDETIGWIYQYYNDPAERQAMRKASQAPRNSRELAVRNQFFTPRYVVEFLTDNTLGRLWYEMCQGDTRLAEQCRYLVRRPNEVFLQQGEDPPQDQEKPSGLSQEELLEQPVHIPYRPTKDPRDLKILDPACGSGHFLLHSFDLLTVIYEEAWTDPYLPPFSETCTKLADDYPDLGALRRAIPGLILRHNLHGIDIDPRAVQIAALAFWLRGQRAYQDLGLAPAERPRITRTNLVTAEPMPGDRELLDEFLRDLRPRVLGDLVRVVFEKMELAGEAGSLLKIEEELAEAIAEAHRLWAARPKAEQMLLFPEDRRPRPEQLPLFDVSGITDAAFWETAKEQALQSLWDYATRVENGKDTRRRLFAEDAVQGFALVDLCRQRFDTVLMNPPFGASSPKLNEILVLHYPDSRYELACCFLEWAQSHLESKAAFVGAIVTRAPFFLYRFANWRKELLKSLNSINVFLDLGQGVLDQALVETVACVLGPRQDNALAIDAREQKSGYEGGQAILDLTKLPFFVFERDGLASLPNAPIAYWAPRSISKIFQTHGRFGDYAEVKQGLQTRNNDRFVRLWWEVPGHELGPKGRWKTFAKGGEFSRFYLPLDLVVDWSEAAMESYLNRKGQMVVLLTAKREKYAFRQGLTYSQRSQSGFSVRVLPRACLYSANGPCVYSKGRVISLFDLAFLNTDFVSAILGLLTTFGSFSEGYVESLPYPTASQNQLTTLAELALDAALLQRERFLYDDTVREFVHFGSVDDIRSLTAWWDGICEGGTKDREVLSRYRNRIEGIFSSMFTLSEADKEFVRTHSDSKKVTNAETILGLFDKSQSTYNLVAYALGAVFSRWDIRFSQYPDLAPKLSDPLEPLPVCPPGMLVGPDGLPATPGNIVSEAWLRARPDAITLPPEGSFDGPATIPDDAYSIRIVWDGILVDDPGLGENPEPHPSDVVRRVREVLAVLWPDNHDAIEAEACEILGVRELRDYLRKPTKFFADHLQRYSKSRRKAPIYWPLSTASGSYTLWLYYHRLDDQILYTAVNRYVTPKIEQVEGYVARLEADLAQITGRAASNLRDQLDQVRAFLAELREFRQELLRIAGLPYKPNLNDGVIINAAPLHKLFGLRKWAKDTEAVWRKLEKGEYDWAHMAYTLWPERVQEVCRHDRSIAIAHGLEELCEVLEKGAKKKAKKKRKARKAEPAATQVPLDPNTSVETAADALLAALQSTDEPLSKAGLLECSGIEADQWNAAIKSLLAAEKIEKTGKGRGAKYTVV